MSAPPKGAGKALTLREEDIETLPAKTRSAVDLVLPRGRNEPADDPCRRAVRK